MEEAKGQDPGAGEPNPLLCVLGSVNADIYVEVDRLPRPGETLHGKDDSGFVLPGGKGANQAVAAANLGATASLVCMWGSDNHAGTLRGAVRDSGVAIDAGSSVDAPSGQAFILLQSGGENSIILVGGANTAWGDALTPDAERSVRAASMLLLQREVPERVNDMASRVASEAGVRVVMDAGGRDTPMPDAVLARLFVFSPNETELARVTGMPTGTDGEVLRAAQFLCAKGVQHVLVKLGARGSLLVSADGTTHRQEAIAADSVVDTTGAGDAFTAAFAVALSEGRPFADAMRFGSATATLAIGVKGAMNAMPKRAAVDELLARSAP